MLAPSKAIADGTVLTVLLASPQIGILHGLLGRLPPPQEAEELLCAQVFAQVRRLLLSCQGAALSHDQVHQALRSLADTCAPHAAALHPLTSLAAVEHQDFAYLGAGLWSSRMLCCLACAPTQGPLGRVPLEGSGKVCGRLEQCCTSES